MKADVPLNEELYYGGVWDDNFMLSQTGSILGGLELSGVDPASVDNNTLQMVSHTIRNILQKLSNDIEVKSFYIHYDGAKVRLKKREGRSGTLSRQREAFLNNNRNLSASKLYWMLELKNKEDHNKLLSVSFLRNLFNSVFEPSARIKVKMAFKSVDATLVEEENIYKLCDKLKNTLDELDLKISFVSRNNHLMDINKVWALSRFLTNFRKDYLFFGESESVPIDDWDKLLPDGEVTPISVRGYDMLKISGVTPIYVRLAQVIGIGGDAVPYGVWSRGENSAVEMNGNYMYYTKYSPMSGMDKSILFKTKRDELERDNISFSQMMKGNSSEAQLAKKLQENPRIKKAFDELDQADYSEDKYCFFSAGVAVFDEDPLAVIETSKKISNNLSSNFSLVWENAGLLPAFLRMQLAYPKRTYRDMEFNTSQTGAAALLYRSDEGISEWGTAKEEPVYYMESTDGVPFGYSMFVGDKCLVLGVGPTRSGKTFLKNCVASHMQKLGGFYAGMDIDAGTEPVARYFHETSSVFRLSEDGTGGFNPFAVATGPEDTEFKAHLLDLLRIMISDNESAEMREFTGDEQLDIAKGLDRTLKAINKDGYKSIPSLSVMVAHCEASVEQKLSRFLRGGMYGFLMDNDVDAIGTLESKFSVFNMARVKDSPILMELAQTEVFYRTTRLFESPENLTSYKFLEVDECQYQLSRKSSAEFFEKKVRTWFKHKGGAALWTQSPDHYLNIPGWETLRASASTFVFHADPEMTRKSYIEAFGLSESECDIIAGLTPKRQAFIKQPELGIAKVVNLFAEAEQYVISTSHPDEMAIMREIYQNQPDPDLAIKEGVERIKVFKPELEEARYDD